MSAVVCAAILLFSCAGCAEEPTPQPTSNSPTAAAPVFASDEEALAAATEAYANYLDVADAIVREGGANASRITPYVSERLAASELESFASLRERNLRGVGESSYSNFTLQQTSLGGTGTNVVSAYVCSDLSGTDVIDENGQSVVSPGRKAKTPYEVTFDVSPDDPQALVVASITIWNGGDVCPL
jgi:hypothetical protein